MASSRHLWLLVLVKRLQPSVHGLRSKQEALTRTSRSDKYDPTSQLFKLAIEDVKNL